MPLTEEQKIYVRIILKQQKISLSGWRLLFAFHNWLRKEKLNLDFFVQLQLVTNEITFQKFLAEVLRYIFSKYFKCLWFF